MGKFEVSARKKEAGFTLVELAVVMIIIGLLIGGVLKGQELIANAQISSTVAQIKGVDAATSTFSDTYAAMPGDMLTATGANGRLPNCAAPNCNNGDGDGSLENVPNNAAQAGEELGFWQHLNAADLVSGVKNSAIVAFGEALPSAPIGGGMVVGFTPIGAVGGLTGANGRGGHYVVVRQAAAAAAGPASAVMSPSQAARIDRKMDDGSPNAGTVLAIGSTGGAAANCANGAAANSVYNEALDGQSCSIAVRIQQ